MKNITMTLVFVLCSCAALKSVPTDNQVKIACTALCTALESDNCFPNPNAQTALDIGLDAVSCIAKCDTPALSLDIDCVGNSLSDQKSGCEDYLSCIVI